MDGVKTQAVVGEGAEVDEVEEVAGASTMGTKEEILIRHHPRHRRRGIMIQNLVNRNHQLIRFQPRWLIRSRRSFD